MQGEQGVVGGAPVLVSQRSGLALPLVVLTAVCAAFALFAILAVLFLTGQGGTARVIGPVPGTDRTRIEVLDGPDPKAWRVPTDEVEGAQPGEVIDVRLGGDCDCEPYPATGDPGGVIFFSSVMLAIFGLVLRSYLRTRRGAVAQAKAARALTADAPVTPVLLAPSIRFVRSKVRAHATLTAADGRVLGDLDLGIVHPAFDPTLRWWLVGEPLVGSSVALVAEGRQQVLLPSSELTPVEEPPPWSATAVRLVRWDRPAAEHPVPVLPSRGRVALGTDGASAPEDEVDAARRAIQQKVGRRFSVAILGILVISLAILFAGVSLIIVFPITILTAVGLSAYFRRSMLATAQEHLPLAPDDQPYAVEIASSLNTWRGAARPAPAFLRTLPNAAV